MSWQDVALRDCVKFLSGGTPSKRNPEYWNGDIPWVSSGEMTRQFIDDTSLHISEAAAFDGSRLVPEGTIFAVVRGMSLATEFRVSYATRRMAFNQDLKGLVVKEGIDPYFLFSSLRAHADQIRDLATEAAHGTKKLELERLESFQVKIPSIALQQKVADVVRNYDDLIETNRRRIALLEESARLLYREWFVNLRFSGHESVKWIDGLPEGWLSGFASDSINVLSGGTPNTKIERFWDGEIPFFTPKDCKGSMFVSSTEKTLTEEGLQACNSRLFAKETIFITARGTVGKVVLAQKPMAMNQSCYALTPKTGFDNLYLFLAIENGVEHLKAMASGGVFDTIVVDTFRRMPFVCPFVEVTKSFGSVVRPIFNQIENLLIQNELLMSARDELLPKLMSGAIRV